MTTASLITLIARARMQRMKLKKMFCNLKYPAKLNEVERIIFHNVEYIVNSDGPIRIKDIQYLEKYPLSSKDISQLKTALAEYNKRRK